MQLQVHELLQDDNELQQLLHMQHQRMNMSWCKIEFRKIEIENRELKISMADNSDQGSMHIFRGLANGRRWLQITLHFLIQNASYTIWNDQH